MITCYYTRVICKTNQGDIRSWTVNGNGTMTCCYSLWDDRGTTKASDETFVGKFCEDCTYSW